jgi:UDP-N-acetylglucosamine 2-epimerase (non-hydrolysing)
MKVAPVLHALASYPEVDQTLLHTGQHYDANMSDVFFTQLGLPAPDVNLGVGSGTHAKQTAEIMTRFEAALETHRPDLVLVYGDVNSTMAAALVCAKLGVLVGHVEAGLRSGDRTMPEEINRLVTDQLADLLFTPSEDANANLRREGISEEKIFCIGNVMIDSLIRLLPEARRRPRNGVPERYALVTLHRPANVDDNAILADLLQWLREISQDLAVVFPVHPRTRARLTQLGTTGIQMLEPQPYLDFLALQCGATVVITDSGGIQEETTFLGIPCLTLRENTERPITVSMGTNVIVGRDPGILRKELAKVLAGQAKKGTVPPLWDGKAASRIAEIVTGSGRCLENALRGQLLEV